MKLKTGVNLLLVSSGGLFVLGIHEFIDGNIAMGILIAVLSVSHIWQGNVAIDALSEKK